MELWEQLEHESNKAFAAFKIYRDIPPAKRSLFAAWQAAKGQQTGGGASRPPGHFNRWYEAFEWQSRATSYDQHLRAIEEEARVELQKESAKRWAERIEVQREDEWKWRTSLGVKIGKMLAFPVSEIITREGDKGVIHEVHPANWRFRDVATLMLAASKIGRLATGQETDRILEIPWDELTPEQLQRIADGEDPEVVIKRRAESE